jgi:hypothetical protein
MIDTKFQEFPKMARLSREIIITEKIDGTNAQVYICQLPDDEAMPTDTPIVACRGNLLIYAGSRTRWITPKDDNFGFAKWVEANADDLVKLGLGRHFGEWWGSGIQRGYGLPKGEKRWSLFNTVRWCLAGQQPQRIQTGDPRIEKYQDVLPLCCGLVPELYRGIMDTSAISTQIERLKTIGSMAAPGFMKPEGIVVFHTAANCGFKKTIENDETPKSLVR